MFVLPVHPVSIASVFAILAQNWKLWVILVAFSGFFDHVCSIMCLCVLTLDICQSSQIENFTNSQFYVGQPSQLKIDSQYRHLMQEEGQ